jgi:hypothetical protein
VRAGALLAALVAATSVAARVGATTLAATRSRRFELAQS